MERKVFRNAKAWKDVLQFAVEEFEEFAEIENAKLPEGYELKVGDELPVGNIFYELSEMLGNDIIPVLEDLIQAEKERVAKEMAEKNASK